MTSQDVMHLAAALLFVAAVPVLWQLRRQSKATEAAAALQSENTARDEEWRCREGERREREEKRRRIEHRHYVRRCKREERQERWRDGRGGEA